MADEMNLQNEPQNIAPNIDSELDAALSKSFSESNEILSELPKADKEAPKKEELKQEKQGERSEQKPDDSSSDRKPKSEARQEKHQEEKKILTPEEVEKIDPKDKGSWGAIKQANKTAHRIIADKETEITKLKSALAEKGSTSTKELETLKSQISELEKYRAMVEVQADPEFISKYDKPIEGLEKDIKEFLKLRNVKPEFLDKINLNDTRLMSQIIGLIDKDEGEITASELRGKIREYLDLTQKRSKTVEEHKSNYKETLEKKKQENFTKQSESEGRMIKHIQAKATENNKEGKALLPFLRKMDLKEGASEGEIENANRHNEMVDQLDQKLQAIMKFKEPEQMAEVAISAVASYWLKAQNKALHEALTKAQEEIKKISTVNTESSNRKAPSVRRNGNNEPEDLDSALAGHFNGRTR